MFNLNHHTPVFIKVTTAEKHGNEKPAKLVPIPNQDTFTFKLYEKHQAQWGRPYYDNIVKYDPVDVNKIYHGNPGHYTTDGGKTFIGTTGDDHALWINPSDPTHLIWGGDGGANQVWYAPGKGTYGFIAKQDGERTTDYILQTVNLPPTGPLYGVGYDMRKPYWVMGNIQDNTSWTIPTQTKHGGVTMLDGERLPGGEAGFSMADPNDWTTVYTQDRDLG